MAAITSAAVIPNLIDIQQDKINYASLQPSPQSTFVEIHSTRPQFESNGKSLSYDDLSHDEMEESNIRGKDFHEKMVSLCEAGVVIGCQQAVEGRRTAARPGGKAT